MPQDQIIMKNVMKDGVQEKYKVAESHCSVNCFKEELTGNLP